MNRRNILACLLAVAVAVLASVARAEHTRYWRQTDFSDFQKGTANGVAIRSDGKLAPAPKFDLFADPNLAYIWALRPRFAQPPLRGRRIECQGAAIR